MSIQIHVRPRQYPNKAQVEPEATGLAWALPGFCQGQVWAWFGFGLGVAWVWPGFGLRLAWVGPGLGLAGPGPGPGRGPGWAFVGFCLDFVWALLE